MRATYDSPASFVFVMVLFALWLVWLFVKGRRK